MVEKNRHVDSRAGSEDSPKERGVEENKDGVVYKDMDDLVEAVKRHKKPVQISYFTRIGTKEIYPINNAFSIRYQIRSLTHNISLGRRITIEPYSFYDDGGNLKKEETPQPARADIKEDVGDEAKESNISGEWASGAEDAVERPPQSETVSNTGEAINAVRQGLLYPLLVIPFGEGSNADQYIVNTDNELEYAVQKASKDSMMRGRVHLFSKQGQGEFWQESRVIHKPLDIRHQPKSRDR